MAKVCWSGTPASSHLLGSALAPHTQEEVLIKVRLLGLNSYQFFTVAPAPDLVGARCGRSAELPWMMDRS